MKRLTISVPDELAARLEREATRRRTSVSEVLRTAAVDHLGLNRPRELPFASLGRSGHSNVAEDMEELIAREWPAHLERHRDR